MARNRSFLSNCFLFVSTIGIALMSVSLGLMGAALISIASGLAVVANNDADTGLSQPGATYLNVRMESLREVRQALATPLRSPAPLPPVVTRISRASGSAPRFNGVIAQSSRHRWTAEARNMLERIESIAPDTQLSAYAEIDRHAVH